MKEVIPIFPLQIVAFPGELISLHIFEPRYKQLIQHCKEKGITFGLTPSLDGEVQSYGTELRLDEIVTEYSDGRFDIRCTGLKCYKQLQFFRELDSNLYPGGEIISIDLNTSGEIALNSIILSHLERLYHLMNIDKPLPDVEVDGLSYKIGHHLGLARLQECELLSIPMEIDRQKYIIAHLESFIPTVIEQEEMRRKIQMNGHFRNLPGQMPLG